jgi:hypothetical protein
LYPTLKQLLCQTNFFEFSMLFERHRTTFRGTHASVPISTHHNVHTWLVDLYRAKFTLFPCVQILRRKKLFSTSDSWYINIWFSVNNKIQPLLKISKLFETMLSYSYVPGDHKISQIIKNINFHNNVLCSRMANIFWIYLDLFFISWQLVFISQHIKFKKLHIILMPDWKLRPEKDCRYKWTIHFLLVRKAGQVKYFDKFYLRMVLYNLFLEHDLKK